MSLILSTTDQLEDSFHPSPKPQIIAVCSLRASSGVARSLSVPWTKRASFFCAFFLPSIVMSHISFYQGGREKPIGKPAPLLCSPVAPFLSSKPPRHLLIQIVRIDGLGVPLEHLAVPADHEL